MGARRKVILAVWSIAAAAVGPLVGCKKELSSADKAAYIADAERRITLPPGAGDLRCYRRRYTILPGHGKLEGHRLLTGMYDLTVHPVYDGKGRRIGINTSGKPGAQWDDKMTLGFADQGCETLYFQYDLDAEPSSVTAQCAPDFSGRGPFEVHPPVVC